MEKTPNTPISEPEVRKRKIVYLSRKEIEDMPMKKNTHTWVQYGGNLSLNVEGSYDISTCRYSVAKYDMKHGLFSVFAFFRTEKKLAARRAQRNIGKKLKKLFGGKKYICVVTSSESRCGKEDMMHLEFYTNCRLPHPQKVGMIKDIVADYTKN